MSIRVDIERLVLQDITLAHADRRALLAAVERTIADQLSAAPPRADSGDRSADVVQAGPIALRGNADRAGHLGSLATGIATATTGALAGPRGSTS